LAATVLVTGGLGYVGSHCCVALAHAGYEPVVLDNLSNARESVLERLRELTGAAIELHRADVRDAGALDRALANRPIEAVAHFAGLKSVRESVERPLDYFDNNVNGTARLLEAMARHGVRHMLFSSSATVYGVPQRLPYTEDHPLEPVNPYGCGKLAIERMLERAAAANPDFHYAALRYFNPVGAHPSGRIGEDPRGVPENLLPYVAQVASGQRPTLRVFGKDYDTPDGTGVRDYLHVMDLAEAHVAALRFLEREHRSIAVNLGTGRGHSVLEVVKAFEAASGRPVPIEFAPRRAGDLPEYWADATLAAQELGWRAARGLEEMCRDAWRWQSQNPDGYV